MEHQGLALCSMPMFHVPRVTGRTHSLRRAVRYTNVRPCPRLDLARRVPHGSAMQIIDGMFQLKVPIPNNPIGYVLPYAFQVPGGIAIIDPGWDADESVDSLKEQLGEIGAGFD